MALRRSFTYPPARRSDIVDDYHGTAVADPYRWLEDPNSEEEALMYNQDRAIRIQRRLQADCDGDP